MTVLFVKLIYLQVNGKNVENLSHEDTVSLVKETKQRVTFKVINVCNDDVMNCATSRTCNVSAPFLAQNAEIMLLEFHVQHITLF